MESLISSEESASVGIRNDAFWVCCDEPSWIVCVSGVPTNRTHFHFVSVDLWKISTSYKHPTRRSILFEDEHQVETFMRRKPAIIEIVSSVTLLILGLYILLDGTSNQSAIADVIVVGGAVCLTLGVLMLFFAGRSILSERRMVRYTRGG